jgi:hypothetical protein
MRRDLSHQSPSVLTLFSLQDVATVCVDYVDGARSIKMACATDGKPPSSCANASLTFTRDLQRRTVSQ